MSKRTFVKYEGIGNDFILIDDREELFPADPASIQRLCHRKFGIGADGLILVQKGQDVRMRFFNCDGSEAACCGNALRCLVHYIEKRTGWLRIEAKEAAYLTRWMGDLPAVQMGQASQMRLALPTEKGAVHFAVCGVPHAVQFVEDVEAVDLPQLGAYFRRHPLFAPQGANANFAAIQPDGSIRMRTYERGVEQETLSCGTGAAAVAAIARSLYGWVHPIQIHFPGGTLTMDGEWMIGPARAVFKGEFLSVQTTAAHL